jgi:hypothetical protein
LVDSASNRSKYQKIFLGSKTQPARKADNLAAICESIVRSSKSHKPIGLHGLLQGWLYFFCVVLIESSIVCIALCAVLFERGVLFGVKCVFLCVVSYCSITAIG